MNPSNANSHRESRRELRSRRPLIMGDREHREFHREMRDLISGLDLLDEEKDVLELRWLDQVLWADDRANKSRSMYYLLRLATIIGGVIVPVLISFGGFERATFVISLIVAISAAVEEFFHYGERWRHYRRTAEALRTLGWGYFAGSGTRMTGPARSDEFQAFMKEVEKVIHRDVDDYLRRIVGGAAKPGTATGPPSSGKANP